MTGQPDETRSEARSDYEGLAVCLLPHAHAAHVWRGPDYAGEAMLCVGDQSVSDQLAQAWRDLAAARAEVTRLRQAVEQGVHRLRHTAGRTADYTAEGVSIRINADADRLAAALGGVPPEEAKRRTTAAVGERARAARADAERMRADLEADPAAMTPSERAGAVYRLQTRAKLLDGQALDAIRARIRELSESRPA